LYSVVVDTFYVADSGASENTGGQIASPASVRADPLVPQIWVADGSVLPPDLFRSARWVVVFWPVCPDGQIQTRGVHLG
jgi:hypothetical protein